MLKRLLAVVRETLGGGPGLCLGLIAITFCTTTSVQANEITIIHAGWLLAVPGNPPLHEQSVVVENGKISRVTSGYLEAADLNRVAKVSVVDLSGAYILPGLIDAHVHLASAPGMGVGALTETEADLALIAAKHAKQTLQAGFTTVVDLGSVGKPGHEQAIFAVRDAVAKGWLAGPRILSAGTPITVTGMERSSTYRERVMETIDSRSVCNGTDDCRRAVRHQVKMGSDIIVFFNTGSLLAEYPISQSMADVEMKAIVETAHALGRKVIADGHHAQGIAAAIRAGADIIDSAHLYDNKTFGLFGAETFLQSHIYGVVRAVGDSKETLRSGLWGWLPEPILQRFLAVRLRPFAMTEAYKAGIRNLSYASDAGVYNWGNNASDFNEFVSKGMAPMDAIMTATVNAARMLGLDRELGSIEPGMAADIIATAGNPISDVAELLRVQFVMRNGVVYHSSQDH